MTPTQTPVQSPSPVQELPVADFDALGAFLQSVGCQFPAGTLSEVSVKPALVRVKLGGGGSNQTITAKYRFTVAPEPDVEDVEVSP